MTCATSSGLCLLPEVLWFGSAGVSLYAPEAYHNDSDKVSKYGFDNTSYMMFYAHSQIKLHGNSCLNIYGKCFHYKMTAESWSQYFDSMSAI